MSKCTRVAFLIGLVGLIWLLAGLAASGDIVERTGTSSVGTEPATRYVATINVGGKRLVGCPNVWYEEQIYGLGGASHGRIGGSVYHGLFVVDGPLCVSEKDLYRHSVVGLQAYRFEGLPFGRAYTIALGFCEPSEHVAVGDRVFDVLVNGEPLLEDFDICKHTRACHAALVVTRVITLADTTTWLQLDFRRNVGSLPPVLSHIGVFEITGDPPYPATKTPTPSSTPSATPTPTETPACGSLPTIILAQITDTVDCPCDVTGQIQITTSGEEYSGPVSITLSGKAANCDPIQVNHGPELDDFCGIPLTLGLSVSIPYDITMGEEWELPTTITVSAHISSLCQSLTDVVTSVWDVGPANLGFDEGVAHWQAYKETETDGPTDEALYSELPDPTLFNGDGQYIMVACLADNAGAHWRVDGAGGPFGLLLGAPLGPDTYCGTGIGGERSGVYVTREITLCDGVTHLDFVARLLSTDREDGREDNEQYRPDFLTVTLAAPHDGPTLSSESLHKTVKNLNCWDSWMSEGGHPEPFHSRLGNPPTDGLAILSLRFDESGNGQSSVGYVDDIRLSAREPRTGKQMWLHRVRIPYVTN